MSSSREYAAVSFEQKIPSCMDEAESLCLRVRGVLQASGLSTYCFPTELLARECLANALKHGNGNNPAKSILLQLRTGRAWIRLRVTDEGGGFDWQEAMQKASSTRKASGRGLQLYALYASRFRFNRCGNRITLWIGKKKRTGNGD
jgi:serine/threonine-protein kinase RsbW